MCPSGRYARRESAADVLVGGSPAGFRQAFDVLDTDRDGKISRDDLRSFYSGVVVAAAAPGRLPTDDDITSMISAADADRDGFVGYHEFERVLGGPAEAVMAEAFRMMDRDGDGRVGFGDLKAYLEMAGLPAGDDDVRLMMAAAGAGDAVAGDGAGISFDALVKMFAAA